MLIIYAEKQRQYTGTKINQMNTIKHNQRVAKLRISRHKNIINFATKLRLKKQDKL